MEQEVDEGIFVNNGICSGIVKEFFTYFEPKCWAAWQMEEQTGKVKAKICMDSKEKQPSHTIVSC